MKEYSAVIIGGGFSGLGLAIVLSERLGGENVAVIEKNDRVGKKLLATGNGRGNISNVDLSPSHYHSAAGAEVANTLEKYGYKSIIRFFNRLGLLVAEEEGKLYPLGFQASAVLDMMRFRLEDLKAEIFTGTTCKKIAKIDGGFKIVTDGGEFYAKKVIAAFGGKSGKQYGTDGTSFGLLKDLGISVTELTPQIVQIKTDTEYIKGLKGLKEKARLIALDGNREVKDFTGDVLFTDYGLSGNAAFFLSSYLSELDKPIIRIEFAKEYGERELTEFLTKKASRLDYADADNILTGVMNKQIGRAVVKRSGAKTLDENSIRKIVSTMKRFDLKVLGTLGFDYSQVTRGGVPFSELCEGFECKKAKGLFVVGEALDVDGDRGGYNLQWAYSSAMVAADKIFADLK